MSYRVSIDPQRSLTPARAPQRHRSRLEVLSHACAAVLGGYALTCVATLCLTILLIPIAGRAPAVMVATMCSFAVYVGAIVWAFAAPTAARAWRGTLGLTAAFGIVVWPALWLLP